jgi:hypothetical protein
MKDLKRTLKIAGIISLVASLPAIISLLMNIFVYPFDPYYVTLDLAEVILSVAAGVIYLVYSGKSEQAIVTKRGLFLALNILNIFSNLIVWAVSFWVEISVNNAYKKYEFNNFASHAYGFRRFGYSNQEPEQKHEDKNEYVIHEDDYTVDNSSQTLKEKLEELNKLREENLISQDEYNNLRKKIINDYIK